MNNMANFYKSIFEAAEDKINRFWATKAEKEVDRFWAAKDEKHFSKWGEMLDDAIAHQVSARNFQGLCDEFVRLNTIDEVK